MVRLVVLLVVTAFSSLPAFAWGKTGHRVVGEIANNYLTEDARKSVEDILGPEGLAEASTWPDLMRSSPDPFWAKEAGPYHYITVPQGKTYDEVGHPPEGDAIFALERFKATLKDPGATLQERQLALRFINHIIGDLHQPLHVGNGTDRGGNDVTCSFFGDTTNLHAIWDSGLIDQEQLSFTEWTAWLLPTITETNRDAWSSTDPRVWSAESAAIRDTVYPAECELSFGYVFDHRETLRLRLSQGGVRLAAYLNALFAK
jgi:hypothetical protein